MKLKPPKCFWHNLFISIKKKSLFFIQPVTKEYIICNNVLFSKLKIANELTEPHPNPQSCSVITSSRVGCQYTHMSKARDGEVVLDFIYRT